MGSLQFGLLSGAAGCSPPTQLIPNKQRASETKFWAKPERAAKRSAPAKAGLHLRALAMGRAALAQPACARMSTASCSGHTLLEQSPTLSPVPLACSEVLVWILLWRGRREVTLGIRVCSVKAGGNVVANKAAAAVRDVGRSRTWKSEACSFCSPSLVMSWLLGLEKGKESVCSLKPPVRWSTFLTKQPRSCWSTPSRIRSTFISLASLGLSLPLPTASPSSTPAHSLSKQAFSPEVKPLASEINTSIALLTSVAWSRMPSKVSRSLG